MDVASVTAAMNEKKEERGKRKKQNYRKKTPAHVTRIKNKKEMLQSQHACCIYIEYKCDY